jgi:hypothetical protein
MNHLTRHGTIFILMMIGLLCGGRRGFASGANTASAVGDSVEVVGTVFNDGFGIPECCVTGFYLVLCSGGWYDAWLQSASLDLSQLVGQEVRLTGNRFLCGDGQCPNLDVTGAVPFPCSTTAASPSSWGSVKRLFR